MVIVEVLHMSKFTSSPQGLSSQPKHSTPLIPPAVRNGIKFIFFATLALITGWTIWIYLQLAEMRTTHPEITAFMKKAADADPKLNIKQNWKNLSHISPHLKRAVIAAEDAAFVDHNGFDWDGIQLAMEKNLKKGRIAAGGSTISQQLAKNLFLSSERSVFRKAKESIITILMENTLSKNRILELYLNYAEWGYGIYGADAAARHHFGVPASRITSWQAARLAAILPNPRYYDGKRTEWMYEKTDIIINRMPKVRVPR